MRALVIVAALLVGLSPAVAGSVYDRNGNYHSSTTTNADGSVSGLNGERTVGRGNKAWTYDSSGQLVRYGIKRGNVLRVYDRNGRYTGSVIGNGSTSAHYDSRGRFIGTSDSR
jgi:hypothetical protein